jgi:hypothetical protein
MRGASVFAVVIAAACWWLGGFALASSGKFDDGNGEGATVDKIDITEVAHDDVANEISYEVTFLNPWNESALEEIVWTLDFTPDNGNATEDACIRITSAGAAQGLEGTVLDGCTDSIADDVTVEHVNNTAEMKVSLPTAALDQANGNKPVTGYAYRIVARDDDAGANQSNDFAPDEGTPPARHELGAAGSASAGPSPSPDANDAEDEDPAADKDEDEDEGSDVDGGPDDDVKVLSAGEPRLPDTGPTSADPSVPAGVRAAIAAGAALLGAGVMMRMLARRSEE